MYLRHLQIARSPDVEGSGGAATTTPATGTAVQTHSEPQTFSVDYVRELRAENKGYRLKAADLERVATEAKTAAEKAAADLAAFTAKAAKDTEAKLAEVMGAANARLVRAEIKAGASAAGLAHADFLKLIDTSTIKVGDDGEVQVPDGFWDSVKAKMPHLFKTTGADTGTTSQTKAPPKAAPAAGKSALQMTDEEAAAAEAALLRGGR